MEDHAPTRSSLSVPFAILIAGGLVAVAVYLSRGSTPAATTLPEQQNNTQPSAQVERAIAIRPVSDSDHVLGNPASPLAIVAYSDLECPFCKVFHATLHQVADTYGKNGSVLWVYRHFPLIELHSKAPKEAEAAECAAELGGKTAFWSFVDELFKVTPSNNGLDPAELPKIVARIGLTAKQVATFNECLSSGKYTQKVMAGRDEAIAAGGNGTPFSVFVAGKKLSDSTIKTIQNINDEFTKQGSLEGPFTISTDKKLISMSGALPFVYVQRVVDALLAN